MVHSLPSVDRTMIPTILDPEWDGSDLLMTDNTAVFVQARNHVDLVSAMAYGINACNMSFSGDLPKAL